MAKYLRRSLIFLLSVVIASVLASIFSTQFVLSDLAKAGAPVGLSDRMSMTVYDALNLPKLYGIFIFITLLIAFPAAGLVFNKMKIKRTFIYIVAGCVGFLVMLILMKGAFFGVDLIAGARSITGKLFQALAGGVAGYVFARLTTPKFLEES